MTINNLLTNDYAELLNSTPMTQSRFQELIGQLIAQTSIIEGSGAPTQQASKHSWYFDTATNKYYRNVDGGTTWVALN